MGQADSSLLLLILASVTVALTVHVAFAMLRRLRGFIGMAGLRSQWMSVLVVAVVLGTGFCASMVLAIGAEGLSFPIGYAAGRAPLLWLAACAVCLPLVALLVAQPHALWLWLVGATIGVLLVLLQVGWIEAVGFRPGVLWRRDLLIFAALLQMGALAAAWWLALSAFTAENERAHTWYGTAVLVVVLAMAGAQELVVTASGMSAQIGSVFVRQVSGAWLCVLAGAVVPVVYGFMAVGMLLQAPARRGSSRRTANLPGGERRKRRRQRIRTL